MDLIWKASDLKEANPLLAREHYLGPARRGSLIFGGYADGVLVAVQVWSKPSSRRLPQDGTWLELARWCLTVAAGPNAGSRQHGAVIKAIRLELPGVSSLVSYSDPSAGHTGALYRACNWLWAPTWIRLRTPPTGNGNWNSQRKQAPKDRWVFSVRPDSRMPDLLRIEDPGAIRHWLKSSTAAERSWARRSPAPDLRMSVLSERYYQNTPKRRENLALCSARHAL